MLAPIGFSLAVLLPSSPPTFETRETGWSEPHVSPDLEEKPKSRLRPGAGRLIASAPFTATGLFLKILGTVFDLQTLDDFASQRVDPVEACDESCFYGGFYNGLSGLFWAPSLALVGSGTNHKLAPVGRMDRRMGRSQLSRARVFTRVGHALLAVGSVGFITLQATKYFVDSDVAYVAMSEIGWWVGLAHGYTGATLAGWGDGYRRGFSAQRAAWTVSPMVRSGYQGFVVSARF